VPEANKVSLDYINCLADPWNTEVEEKNCLVVELEHVETQFDICADARKFESLIKICHKILQKSRILFKVFKKKSKLPPKLIALVVIKVALLKYET
jgi:hypothetical protein